MSDPKVFDLRSALDVLRGHEGQLIETDHPVDPHGELAGVYRRVGAGGTVERPTRLGPAMMFNNVKGYPGSRVLVGVMASRDRVGLLLDSAPEHLTQRIYRGLEDAIAPVVLPDGSEAPCQEVVHLATDLGFDLRTLLPAPTNTDLDAGPYFCLGLALASKLRQKPEQITQQIIDHLPSSQQGNNNPRVIENAFVSKNGGFSCVYFARKVVPDALR